MLSSMTSRDIIRRLIARHFERMGGPAPVPVDAQGAVTSLPIPAPDPDPDRCVRVSISLPAALVQRIDGRVGPRQRSAFLAAAARAALA